ncbi:endogenous retrovirus group K member 8 Pro protein-like [Dasypus novemcinctus]|uniref:endogenous retrovirus group K member 8 Pro protein-like n=1 Tax=Dasypus novemcinctus TaxID=9361 RepID=UPI0039C9C2FD
MSPASQPRLTIKVNGKWMDGLLDTGAEVSCIPLSQAHDFPLTAGPIVVGATGQSSSQQAAEDLAWRDTDGWSGFFRPLVLKDIKQVLWGCDILHQSGAVLFTPQPLQSPQ